MKLKHRLQGIRACCAPVNNCKGSIIWIKKMVWLIYCNYSHSQAWHSSTTVQWHYSISSYFIIYFRHSLKHEFWRLPHHNEHLNCKQIRVVTNNKKFSKLQCWHLENRGTAIWRSLISELPIDITLATFKSCTKVAKIGGCWTVGNIMKICDITKWIIYGGYCCCLP